jgi:uncharacterized membrane protein YdbT with pleckstrin-like domain
MKPLLSSLARGAYESVRETLPADEHEAGVFVAGMAWAFVIYCFLLIIVSWVTAKALGLSL